MPNYFENNSSLSVIPFGCTVVMTSREIRFGGGVCQGCKIFYMCELLCPRFLWASCNPSLRWNPLHVGSCSTKQKAQHYFGDKGLSNHLRRQKEAKYAFIESRCMRGVWLHEWMQNGLHHSGLSDRVSHQKMDAARLRAQTQSQKKCNNWPIYAPVGHDYKTIPKMPLYVTETRSWTVLCLIFINANRIHVV